MEKCNAENKGKFLTFLGQNLEQRCRLREALRHLDSLGTDHPRVGVARVGVAYIWPALDLNGAYDWLFWDPQVGFVQVWVFMQSSLLPAVRPAGNVRFWHLQAPKTCISKNQAVIKSAASAASPWTKNP